MDLIPFMNIFFYLNVLFNDPYVFILYLTNEVNSLHQHKFRKIPCICASIVAQNIFVPMVPKVTFGGSFGFGCLNLRWKLRSSVNSAFGRSLTNTNIKLTLVPYQDIFSKEDKYHSTFSNILPTLCFYLIYNSGWMKCASISCLNTARVFAHSLLLETIFLATLWEKDHEE